MTAMASPTISGTAMTAMASPTISGTALTAMASPTISGDSLTLLRIVPPHSSQGSPDSPYLASSLGSLCKACKPEVEVEALWIHGPKLATVMSQVKKLEVYVLVLGQKKPSSLFTCLCGRSSTEKFVEECINNVECLTIGVRKQEQGHWWLLDQYQMAERFLALGLSLCPLLLLHLLFLFFDFFYSECSDDLGDGTTLPL